MRHDPLLALRAADLIKSCTEHLGIQMGETTKDGLFTLMEVECLGACVNAPMIQINDDYYEDLTPESMKEILVALAAGKDVPVGSQTGRKGSMAISGPTTLEEGAKKPVLSKAQDVLWARHTKDYFRVFVFEQAVR